VTANTVLRVEEAVGANKILDPRENEAYQLGGMVPDVIVSVDDEKDISSALLVASQHSLCVSPWGGGTHQFLGNTPSRIDIILDLSKYNRVLDFQPADLTVTVEAGITLDDLKAVVSSSDKLVPIESPAANSATIGGILATGRSGPLRYTYGLPKDWVIGSRVVSATGEVAKSGGKVVKNVTGYDLNKLYCGSLGTLGVISEVTFKLAPHHPSSSAIIAELDSLDKACEFSSLLMSKVYAPQGIHILNNSSEFYTKYGLSSSESYYLVILFCGRAPAVLRRVRESTNLLMENGVVVKEQLSDEKSDALIEHVTNLGSAGENIAEWEVLVNIMPDNFLQVWRQCETLSLKSPLEFIGDPAFGTIRISIQDSDDMGNAVIIDHISQLRRFVDDRSGALTIWRCPSTVKEQLDVWGGNQPELRVMARIKDQFDPNGTLNPCRFMGRL
tara:strand:- start:11853 stop:13184 length:1332 start_codon:yes stop_codon:yes gene_type:complete